MAWELKKVEEQRKQLIELYFDGTLSMTEICDRFGVSRKTGYKWIHRYNELGDKGLLDLPKSPKNPHTVYSDEIVKKAISLKLKHINWGPKKILILLKRTYPEKLCPSERRLYDIFKANGLVTKRRIRRRVPATEPLKSVQAPNDTWMGDFKGWFRTGNGQKCEPFTLTDGQSRYVIRCLHLRKKNAHNVWMIIETAFLEHGLPKHFRTDNGPPFGSTAAGRITALSVNLIKAGVMPEWIEPGHPEQNGRHERFHLTLKQEVAMPPAKTLTAQNRLMQDFVYEYNFERPHEALDMKTPSECYGCSPRSWDGKLRSPEYDSSEGDVRKVGQSGTITIRGIEYYVGQALSGEYIQLKEDDQFKKVYYGPLVLGCFNEESGFKKIKNKKIRK